MYSFCSTQNRLCILCSLPELDRWREQAKTSAVKSGYNSRVVDKTIDLFLFDKEGIGMDVLYLVLAFLGLAIAFPGAVESTMHLLNYWKRRGKGKQS